MPLVMETSRPPLMTSDSDLYNSSAGPKTNVSNPNMNNTDDFKGIALEEIVYISIISTIEIPLICLAIYAVYSLIKSNQAAPVFVINLLISDLILIVSKFLLATGFNIIMYGISMISIYWSGFIGLYFMTCIAIERYIMIAHPVWHRTHRSVKCLVCTSLTGWFVSFIVFPIIFIKTDLLFFTPFIFYPVIILCFVGSCRSLSRSKSLTPLKKQLVLAPLFFVVISYTFLILPVNIIFILAIKLDFPQNLDRLFFYTSCLYMLNPLVDCLLYVFMRSDSENIIRMPDCCTRLKRVESETRHTTSTDVQHDHV